MRKRLFILILICAAALAIVPDGELRGEYLFLKDGPILQGKILRESGSGVTMKLADGKTRTVPRVDILRILYTELYMGKVYVQKTDGSGMELYQVDEDTNSYTFRKDLNRADEIKIPRGDVLFIARKNPSGLTGTPDKEYIDLAWRPPYNQVRGYKIYIREGRDGPFKLLDTTSSLKYRVKGLKARVLYTFKVTAIDRENYESLPSNEIFLTSGNNPPTPPKNVHVSLNRADDGSVLSGRIS